MDYTPDYMPVDRDSIKMPPFFTAHNNVKLKSVSVGNSRAV